MRHGVFKNFSTRFASGSIFKNVQSNLPGFISGIPVKCCTDKQTQTPVADGFWTGYPVARWDHVESVHCCLAAIEN